MLWFSDSFGARLPWRSRVGACALRLRMPRRSSLHRTSVILLGGAVLLAAAAKAVEQVLAPKPIGATSITSIGAIFVESVLAIWMLSGFRATAACRIAICCFSVFAFAALSKGLRGEASCGCFGRFQVSPWTTLALDLIAIPALLFGITPPTARRGTRSFTLTGGASAPILGLLMLGIFSMLVLLMINLSDGLESFANGPMASSLLEPKEWVGKRLPIITRIDCDADLTTGNWLIVLYHAGCPDCKRTITACIEYLQHAPKNTIRVAFIEVPPFSGDSPTDGSTLRRFSEIVFGRVRPMGDSLLPTPAVLVLRDAKVVRFESSFFPDLMKEWNDHE